MSEGIQVSACARLRGNSAIICGCKLPDGGWLPCPGPKVMTATYPPAAFVTNNAQGANRAALSGDICATCGSPDMMRAGTCLVCRNCGDTSGGCS